VTLIAFTIPAEPAELPGWLERRLVAPDFARFIAELRATHPEPARTHIPVRLILGDWFSKVLSDGFAGVPVELLRQLLQQPRALFDLQAAVLSEGGHYWDEVAKKADELTAAVNRGKTALEAILGTAMRRPAPPRPAEPPPQQTSPPPPPYEANPRRDSGAFVNSLYETKSQSARRNRSSRAYRIWALASTAIAACLLVAVVVLALRDKAPHATQTAAVNWGWAKPDGIPQHKLKPSEYLNSLATTAGEWFDKRPDDAAGLAKRLNEFRTGCSQLILSPHTSLAPVDREWLVEKCRLWAKKLDEHITALETGSEPLKVREAADETIHKLQGALRERATQMG
jgi:hypothetical protein